MLFRSPLHRHEPAAAPHADEPRGLAAEHVVGAGEDRLPRLGHDPRLLGRDQLEPQSAAQTAASPGPSAGQVPGLLVSLKKPKEGGVKVVFLNPSDEG